MMQTEFGSYDFLVIISHNFVQLLPALPDLWKPRTLLGTDTTGDVRIPACFCGVLCFKSSHGVVSTLGTIANSQSLDTIGIISLISNLHIERF